ncbi:thiamine-phosphate kinase [Sphingomonas gellani]|uniref:Thiamine-monophosphate kinase n=1 Tax=Sphingomonas gellani TaxID=1166340 RepID=A0A1H8G7B0_9SPHN|nr:thiamine-phosphate kinase [Sphingomonas gellani]SEN39635.1 thiamine-phosphate kinase [Sphingomonas gellani]
MTESEFLNALRRLPLHPGARGLLDDAALVDAGPLVLTTDTLVGGVHFLPDDPAEDVAWKLVAVSLSDLAAKGARPEGVLLNYPLAGGEADARFLAGLDAVLRRFDVLLIGGDTVSLPPNGTRVLSVTAIGADAAAPPRSGGRAGDSLWVTGTIGNGGAGLAVARAGEGPAALLSAYRRPWPRLAEGRAVAPHVHAMADISDGLLIDATRMASASGLGVTIALDSVPLSPEVRDWGMGAMEAATAGDDYELLFAAAADWVPPVAATRVGSLQAGAGLTLTDGGVPVALPAQLGFQHGG